MRSIGFSTGALARGDFRRGIRLQNPLHAKAIEISALRFDELEPIARSLEEVSRELIGINFKSFHAPSEIPREKEEECVKRIDESVPKDWMIVVHPDAIHDFELWKRLGNRLCIENMDQRKSGGRTYAELEEVFERLPDARFCFDIGHCHQVDPTMTEAVHLLTKLSDRLALVHVSEVNHLSHHVPITFASFGPFSYIKEFLPHECPLIIESVVDERDISREYDRVYRCFALSTSSSMT